MERVRPEGAGRGVGLEERMPEAVSDAGRHRAAEPGRQVVDQRPGAGRGVVHVDDQLVAVVVLERVGGDHRLLAERRDRVGRRHRDGRSW